MGWYHWWPQASCSKVRAYETGNDIRQVESEKLKGQDVMFPKIVGFPPKSSISIGFSIINHPFWGTPIFGNSQMFGFFGRQRGETNENTQQDKNGAFLVNL